MNTLHVRHRMIRAYELEPVERNDAPDVLLRVEVWKDLIEKKFWVRVYELKQTADGKYWVLDEDEGWSTIREPREPLALETALGKLNQRMLKK